MTALHQVAARTGSTTSRWRRLLVPGAVAATVAAASWRVYAVDPHQPGHYPVCLTYSLAGIYCPGCGMLRSTHNLLHGDVAGALQRNPLLPPLAVLAVALFVLWTVRRWQGRPLTWTPSRWMPWVLAVGFVAFTIARNVPGLEFLGPGA